VQRHVVEVDGEPAPSRLDEYVFFQIVVGAYPFEGLAGSDARLAFAARIAAYMEKASHEAKLRTSWLAPNAAYDAATAQFVRASLADDELLGALAALVEIILPLGATNSVAQLAVRLGSPGIPDVYQGTELWNSSLVDPDNRRPVDYGVRREALDGLRERGAPSSDLAKELVSSYRDGRIKMHVMRTGLRMRREAPALFLEGAYRPIATDSPHLFAFARSLGDAEVVVVAPRLTWQLVGAPRFALGSDWRDIAVDLGVDSSWENAFTGERLQGKSFGVGDVLRTFPVAWLRRGWR